MADEDEEEYYYCETSPERASDVVDTDEEVQFLTEQYHKDPEQPITVNGDSNGSAITLDSDESFIVLSSDSDNDDDVYIIEDELNTDEKENSASPQKTASNNHIAETSTKNGKATPSKVVNGKVTTSKQSAKTRKRKRSPQERFYMEESDSDGPSFPQHPPSTNFTFNTSLHGSTSSLQNLLSLDDILDQMPDNPKYWSLLPTERFPTPKSKRGRWVCQRCQERGHAKFECTNPPKVTVCPLCGTKGHTLKGCPSPLCSKCHSPGHTSQYCLYQPAKCSHCKLIGHLRNECPDFYRRFYLTVEPGPIRKGSPEVAKHCHNCGYSGHHSLECKSEKFHPSHPGILSFQDPVDEKMSQQEADTKWHKKQICVAKSNKQYSKQISSGSKKIKLKPKQKMKNKKLLKKIAQQKQQQQHGFSTGSNKRNKKKKKTNKTYTSQSFSNSWI